jgi:pyruvate,water dikinase
MDANVDDVGAPSGAAIVRAVVSGGPDSVAVTPDEILEPSANCGGKARTLAALSAAGVPVPAFIVVRGVRLIAPPGGEPTSAWQSAQLLDRADVEAALLRRVEKVAHERLGTPVAVRSSSPLEDAHRSSFAGQFRSFLGVDLAADLATRLKDVWASGFLRRAALYSDAIGVADSSSELMPVIVQRQIVAALSGVIFTRNPTDPTQVCIEAVLGTGESLVGGSSDPDRLVVDADGRRTYTVGGQDEATLVLARHGSVTCPVPPHLRAEPALSDRQIDVLLRLAREVEAVLDSPSDIEFAVDGSGAVWIVQARPITA